jgi:hypothetical protein
MGGFAAMEVSLISAMVERSAPRMSVAHDRAGIAVRLCLSWASNALLM